MNLFNNTDILGVMGRFRNVDKVFKVVYVGKGVSLNDYYTSGHWSKRANLKNKYKKIFTELLEKSEMEKVDKFSILVRYNSRHDVDNVTGLEKLFVDTLKGTYIKEDDKKFYRGYMVFPDEQLKTNTFEFYIISHGK